MCLIAPAPSDWQAGTVLAGERTRDAFTDEPHEGEKR
jgi:hypothetical protein